MRRLALDTVSNDQDVGKTSTRQAMTTATAMRNALGNILDLDEHSLHCSIKVFQEDGHVATWARSSPLDDRPVETSGEAKPISDGTPWCALMGKDDGITRWRKIRCFASNDLTQANEKRLLTIGRENWSHYYKSALVFPLIYYNECENNQSPVIFGFLCFDSPEQNAFPGLPDIFRYRDPHDLQSYHRALSKQAAFHMGAIMADTLSVFLRPFYELRQRNGVYNKKELND